MVKSFKTLAQSWTEEEYRQYPAYHYSALSTYARGGFEAIKHLDEPKESDALTFGSIVDTLLTDHESFHDRFIICDVPFPAPAIKTVIDDLFNAIGDQYPDFDAVPDESILTYSVDIYTNFKEATKINKIRTEGGEYYNFLVKAAGKAVIEQEMFSKAQQCAITLRNNPTTSILFDTPKPGIEILYQSKFLHSIFIGDEEREAKLKIMVDILVVDHNEKTIQPIDLKTTGQPEYRFYQSFVKWGYNIQAELYSYVLQQLMDADDTFKDYKLLPFKFLVINADNLQPLLWEWDVNNYYIPAESYAKLGLKNWVALLVRLDAEKDETVPLGIYPTIANSLISSLLLDKLSRGEDIKVDSICAQ